MGDDNIMTEIKGIVMKSCPYKTNIYQSLKKQSEYTMNHRYRKRAIPLPLGRRLMELLDSHRRCFPAIVLVLGFFLLISNIVLAEYVRELDVSEGVPVGYPIGYIGENLPGVDSGPPYLIVPVPGSGVDTDLTIDHSTGEIRTKVRLDRETRASYNLVAIPLSGENVRVLVRVHDENDNAPTFPISVMKIEFPENTPRDVKRTLHPARDLDIGRYNIQRYNIVSGNINNEFRLSSHRERDGVLYLDLQINGLLDRETTPFYSLVIEALDGGSPPLRGQMTVNITLQDVNDNQPIFNQSRYLATIPENATLGTAVLQVYATDADADDNGLIEYAINRRQSDREQMFRIDAQSGWIAINKPLDFETKELHELVIVAKDHGETPLETTAFVSISVTDVNDNQPTINVIFLSDDATPKISESAQPGEFVARISVNDPDLKTEYSNVNVTLNGGEGHFGLTTRDNIIYLVIVNMTLDRELIPNYTLSVVATDNGSPPLHASKTIYLRVTDINDNAPEFDREVYQANVMEISEPGTSVLQVYAYDRDEGNNSAIIYSLMDTPETHSDWFQIKPNNGLITTRTYIDCETEPVPQIIVIAYDNGHPPLSSTATVLVTIHDVNDNEPIFDNNFYNITVVENAPLRRCFVKVTAVDADCGVNAMVNYTLNEENQQNLTEFEIRSASGEICITEELDFEKRNIYEFPVVAYDRGGLSTTAMVKIHLIDINDNRPAFYPGEYNVSLRESTVSGISTSILTVIAHDPDTGRFGAVTYRIISGNEAGIFRIDRTSGEIFVNRPGMLTMRNQAVHVLNVTASDGGGLRTIDDALVNVRIMDATQRPPMFEKLHYNFYVKEDADRGAIVGSVIATNTDASNANGVRYSIYSGDPDNFFSIDENSGNIRVNNDLDSEIKSIVLLNIKATAGLQTKRESHTQAFITVEDINDNSPEFVISTVHFSVPENAPLGKPLYTVNAYDKDSGENGEVTYKLTTFSSTMNNNVTMSALAVSLRSNSVSAHTPQNFPAANVDRPAIHYSANQAAFGSSTTKNLFTINARSGHLTLLRHLDYETAQRHTLIVTAWDSGNPARYSNNLTIVVEVQDVNDNPPVFEHNEYHIEVLESLSVNSQVSQRAELKQQKIQQMEMRITPK